MGNILIVEDDADTRWVLKAALESGRHACATAASGAEALGLAEALTFDAVVLDMVLGDSDGLTVLAKLKNEDPGLPVVILTGHANVQSAVKAMKLGALDYLIKPFGNEELLLIIEKAVKERRLKREFDALRSHVKRAQGSEPVFGSSKEIKNTAALARQVAATDLTVILSGPSGAGKEVWAREIHRLSSRGGSPFVALDCGALPENLVESELFGYERGAFTGADRRKPGLFEVAFGGTLFLDEIANLTTATQAKLLRVLEDSKVRRLGSKSEISVDVRVLASTNKVPEDAVSKGELRSDLYFRLNVVRVAVPPLRERLEDLEDLTAALLEELNRKHNRNVRAVAPEIMEQFRQYPWPGNVRELRNMLERALVICAGEVLTRKDLSPEFGRGAPPAGADDGSQLRAGMTVGEAERRLIFKTLASTGNNKTRAAELLGISLKTLHNKLKEYETQPQS